MKVRGNESSKKLVCGGAAAAWLLVPLLVLVVLKTDCLPQVTRLRETNATQISDFFFSMRQYGLVSISKNNNGVTSNQVQYPGATKENVVQSVTQVSDETVRNVSSSGLESEGISQQQQQQLEVVKLEAADDFVAEAPPSSASGDKIAGDGVDAIKDLEHEKDFLAMNGEIDGSLQNSDMAAPRSKLTCNFSSRHMDICAMEGDVRVHGKSATVYLLAASNDSYWPENGTVTVRPFTRKYELSTMEMVREVTIRPSAPVAPTDDTAPPRCMVTHDVPAVVFSTGPDRGNFFHGMGDLIIPLYNTAREYDGHVQLMATDYNPGFISHYQHILAALSVYPVIDFDADEAVHCFPSVRVGIETHGELLIDPALSRKGYTMVDFREFLRSAYSLKHARVSPASRSSSGKRPRLVMVLREHSRAITNEAEAIATATEVGFDVVAAGPEMVHDIARFAEVVNACDVIVGVHGAGLTNMLFLPHNGTVMQIIPWGGLKFICWHEFGRPVPDMGLRYVEYEVDAEETTLKDVYPRDHPVFTDPISVQHQGFSTLFSIFLDGQNVTLHIGRFKGLCIASVFNGRLSESHIVRKLTSSDETVKVCVRLPYPLFVKLLSMVVMKGLLSGEHDSHSEGL
uniref:Uncharacterized protein n=1 Tax=Avena sativa TaxID=4498 RepID=A0ACD5VB83_AVESA